MLKIIYDDIHWLHSGPGDHPENPGRLEIIKNILVKKGFWNRFVVEQTIDYSIEDLYMVHSREYVEWIIDECRKGFHYIDSDTYVSKHSFEVAARFSSTAREIGYRCLRDRDIWFILNRPPGHHVGFNGVAMNAPTQGFCIFNHVAVLTKFLLDYLDTVVIIDFDLHHGNGTQEIFWSDSRVIHIDIHEYSIYPGTGGVMDIGGGRGVGFKINIPLSRFSDDCVYVWVLNNVIEPIIYKYKPRIVIVSAGFDSYMGESMCNLNVSDKTFYLYGSFFHDLYSKNYVDSIINILEGGYSIGLRNGFIAYLEGLMGISREEVFVESKPPRRDVYNYLRKILYKYHGLEIS